MDFAEAERGVCPPLGRHEQALQEVQPRHLSTSKPPRGSLTSSQTEQRQRVLFPKEPP